MKSIKVSDLVYEMLLEISKAVRKKPEVFLEDTIKDLYKKKK